MEIVKNLMLTERKSTKIPMQKKTFRPQAIVGSLMRFLRIHPKQMRKHSFIVLIANNFLHFI